MKFTILVLATAFAFTTSAAFADDDEGENFTMATNAKWKEECGSCHITYPPRLLPTESWAAIMTSLDKHFGADASIDDAANQEISRFLASNSKPLGLPNPPLRITEREWFKHEHEEVGAAVWKRKSVGSPANCSACHQHAADLNYDEDAITIPK